MATSEVFDDSTFCFQLLTVLGSRAVRYAPDYMPSPPPPKKLKTTKEPTDSSGPITIHVKTLKPPATYTLPDMLPSATIMDVKGRLQEQVEVAPSEQRLLLKGKSLQDTKALGEYAVTDGAVLHLMVTKAAASSPPKAAQPVTEAMQVDGDGEALSAATRKILSDHGFWTKLRGFLASELPEKDVDPVLDEFLSTYRHVVGRITAKDLASNTL